MSDNNDISWLGAGGLGAALLIAQSIIDGYRRYYQLQGAYDEQSERRYLKRTPSSLRQLIKMVNFANRMGFETAETHGKHCPMCGYKIIPEVRIIQNDVKIEICPMCQEVICAEDRLHQMLVLKKEHEQKEKEKEIENGY